MAEPSKLSARDAYETITRRILELLDKGVVPWRQPWRSGWPHNLFSKRDYRGINVFLLVNAGFGSAGWATANQIRKHGGRIRVDQLERPSRVFFMRPNQWWVWNEPQHIGWQEEGILCKVYEVWNWEQTEGLDDHAPKPSQTKPVELAEQLVNGMPCPPAIKRHPRHACYYPREDVVAVPPDSQFQQREEYYCTLFHELIHATGHESRLERASLRQFKQFGDHDYSQEELVAELGAAMLCGLAGIAPKTIENSAAYIQSWLRVLKNEKSFVVRASGFAQKACDYIRGVPVLPPAPPAKPPPRTPGLASRLDPTSDELEQRISAEALDMDDLNGG
jgi:antirestriction protein ArdC